MAGEAGRARQTEARMAALLAKPSASELAACAAVASHDGERRFQTVVVEMLFQAGLSRQDASKFGDLAWNIHESLSAENLPASRLTATVREGIGQEVSIRSDEIPQLIVVNPSKI